MERAEAMTGGANARAHLGACIEATGAKNERGYGYVWRDGKHVREHRLAFAEANGLTLNDIKGKVVRHSCDNPSCVNPEHLEIGTQADNVQDMLTRGRKTTVRGSAHKVAKLNEADIPKIRLLLADGKSQREVARAFGVNQKLIWRIATGKSWRHVE